MIYVAAFSLLVAALSYISLKRVGALIALAICMFGVESFFAAKSTFFVDHSSFANLVILAALVARCLLSFVRGELVNPITTVTWRLSVMLLAFALLTYFWTPKPDRFLENWQRGAPYIVIYLMIIPMMMSSMEVARSTLIWVLGIGAVFTLLLFLACDWDGRGVVLAGQSRFADKRDTAAVLAIAQLGGTMAIIAALIRLESRRYVTVIRWAIVILGLLIIVRTGSRGQTVAAVACIATFLPLHSRSISLRGVVTVLGSIAAAGLIGYYLYVEYGNQGRWLHAQTALERRTDMWQGMLKYWSNDGVFAWFFGLGNASAYRYVGFYIHNIPIEILCEEGLIGFALFFFLVKRALSNGYLALQVGPLIEPSRFNVLVIFTALFCYEAVLNLKSGSLHSQQLFMLYGIALEVALVGWQSYQNLLLYDDEDEEYEYADEEWGGDFEEAPHRPPRESWPAHS